jgi:membrane-associated phospholipid phosphatase
VTAALGGIDGSSRRPVIRRAILWLLFLGPFFYLTYGTANWLASLRGDVPNLALGWESRVPFIAWSIVPYWSVNLFYAIALFVNESPEQVDRLAKRYLTAQIIAVICFVAFPLTATFVKPETSGLPGFMFDVLGGFDKPFNQAPSLHIALLIVIWDQMRRIMSSGVRIVWHIWCLLIGLSVLTTYQHHAVDIPAGALLGFFVLWLFPRTGPSPLAGFHLTDNSKARRLGSYYLAHPWSQPDGLCDFLVLASPCSRHRRGRLFRCRSRRFPETDRRHCHPRKPLAARTLPAVCTPQYPFLDAQTAAPCCFDRHCVSRSLPFKE